MSILPLSTTRASSVVFRKTTAFALTALLAIAIAILTLAPVSVPNGLPANDKLYHLISFAVLVLPSAVLYRRALLWLLPCAILFGGAIEIIQPAVGRDGEWPDLYADIWGIGIGVLVGLCFVLIQKCFKSHDSLRSGREATPIRERGNFTDN